MGETVTNLVAPDLFGDMTKGFEDVQAKLLTLLVFEDGDILNVADSA